MKFETINVAYDDGMVTLTLNRPESFNAMTPKMGREVAAATREIAADPQARVLVIAGAGMAFCSGGDLGMLARSAGIDCGPDAEHSMAEAPKEFYRGFLSILDSALPTIAAIHGAAIGAGLCLALACDIRLAARDTKLGLTFARLGIHPGMGATYFLPRFVGIAKAYELLFTGRVVDGVEAERIGLVNRAVPRGELTSSVAALAREISGSAPIVVQMLKRSVRLGLESDLESVLDREAELQARAFRTADAREGIQAALDRRSPMFRGPKSIPDIAVP